MGVVGIDFTQISVCLFSS